MRLAIITGGSKGLGKALCEKLMAQGYRVIEFSRTAPHDYSTALNLESPLQVAKDVRHCLSNLPHQQYTELLVFNNAGTLAPIGPAWRKPTEAVLANLNVNFSSAIVVLTEVIQHFRNTNCRKLLVNISSGAALKGYAGWSLYCASKAGMESFIRGLAAEEKGQAAPFLAISIDPGVIDTDMQALIRSTPAEDFPDVERFTRRKHEGGLSPAEQTATAILKLVERDDLQSGGRYDLIY